jgi:hypothetical protein
MICLMEVLLHGGTVVSGWTARQIHEAIFTNFPIGADRYGLNQLRYDLRKLKAHGLLACDAKRYAYRLTEKGTKVALLFILFYKQLCGPLANSLFHRQPTATLRPNRSSKPPSIKPTTPSKTSFNCSKQHDFVEVFLFTNAAVRIYMVFAFPYGVT